MFIIITLIVALVIIVVIVSGIQQRKETLVYEKRGLVAKQKAIIDETDVLISSLALLPSNPILIKILNNRSLSAAKTMIKISPENNALVKSAKEIEARAIVNSGNNAPSSKEQNFTLPNNEKQLIAILQCIKKLRIVLKSEQKKGNLSAQSFSQEDIKLSAMQLKIGVETIEKRGNAAMKKEMLGSARQYFEKALQTISQSPVKTEYCNKKREEIEGKIENIVSSLKNANAKDAENKAKESDDDIDMLFQPKKKW